MCFSLVSFNLSPICTVPSRCETVWAWRRFYSCLHHRAITSHVFEPRLGRLISLNLFIFTLMRAYCNSLMHLMTCSGSSVGQRLPPFLACYCKFYSPPPLLSHYRSVWVCAVCCTVPGGLQQVTAGLRWTAACPSVYHSLPEPPHRCRLRHTPHRWTPAVPTIESRQTGMQLVQMQSLILQLGWVIRRTRVTVPLTSPSHVHINEHNRINYKLIFPSDTIFSNIFSVHLTVFMCIYLAV